MDVIEITSQISYLPANKSPLSSDVIFIRGQEALWVFDLGFGEDYVNSIFQIAEQIRSEYTHSEQVHSDRMPSGQLEGSGNAPFLLPIHIVLSHFHQDHIANLSYLYDFEDPELAPLYDITKYQIDLFLGSNTFGYTHFGKIISEDLWIEDGLSFHLFPMPSTHAKGCMGLEVRWGAKAEDGITFLGDATYPAFRKEAAVYNVQFLKEGINTLCKLNSSSLFLSHQDSPIQSREQVVNELENIYRKRKPGNPYIPVSF